MMQRFFQFFASRKGQIQPLLRPRQVEGRELWLVGFAVTVTLALTAGIIFLSFYGNHAEDNSSYWADPKAWVRGLAAFVLLFDLCTIYQHLQLQRVRAQRWLVAHS
jgi:hypothetical protein